MDVEPALLDVISALLGTNLVGIYAYASAPPAEPATTALLLITGRDVRRDTKYGLTQTFLRHASAAAPLEALVVRQADLTADPAVLVQLHYTEDARQQFAAQIGSTAWLRWPDGPTGSVDRTELSGQLQRTGRTIAGRPLAAVLGETLAAPAQPPANDPSVPSRQLSLE